MLKQISVKPSRTCQAPSGSAATTSSVHSWFPKLDKPSFNPPSSVFGPTWTTPYLMMGIADHIVAFASISGVAALLLVPYLLWTTFATVLNASIWRLNR